MKCQYESEILFKLMERDGLNIPSSVPPYEAEIKAYLINQVKQAYPKLTDYEAEWLLYNYTKHLPAEFPIRSVTNATSATFENVVPFAYQNAILKGQTLVNLFTSPIILNVSENIKVFKFKPLQNVNSKRVTISLMLPIGYKYAVYYKPLTTGKDTPILNYTNTPQSIFTFPEDVNDDYVYIWTTVEGVNKLTNIEPTILEGDYTNIDIPYFEGMKSVQMAVLTTGKNLFNIKDNTHVLTKLENGNYIATVGIELNLPKFKEKTSYTLSFSVSENPDKVYQFPMIIYTDNTELAIYRPNGTFNGNPAYILTSDSTRTISSIIFSYGVDDKKIEFIDLQIEEGSTATTYEPYKSIILPANILTTTGKNLFNMNAIVQDDFELNKYQTGYYGKEFTLQPNTTYTIKPYLREDITNTSVWTVFNVLIQGEVFSVLNVDKTGTSGQNQISQTTFTTDSTGKVCYSIYSHLNSRESWLGNLPFIIQLEKGSAATSYEPHQSNILTVNEPIELCGIGDGSNRVEDELDCLTGEVTERIGEFVLDGSEDWINRTDVHIEGYIYFQHELDYILQSKDIAICERLPYFNETDISSEQLRLSTYDNRTLIGVRLSESKGVSSSDEFSDYLKSNPIKFKYPLATESNKTVDLTTVNEKGETTHFMPLEGTMHVQSSGEIIQPTFDMSVPVEATTQNLASFIDLEME